MNTIVKLTMQQQHARLIAKLLRAQVVSLRHGAIDNQKLRKVVDPICAMHESAAASIEDLLREAVDRGWGDP